MLVSKIKSHKNYSFVLTFNFGFPNIVVQLLCLALNMLKQNYLLKTVFFGHDPLLYFSKGSMQEKTGRDHSGNEGHFSCNGSVFVPSQL